MAKVLIFMVFLMVFTTNCNNSQAAHKGARTQVQGKVEKARGHDVTTLSSEDQRPALSIRPAAWETEDYLPILSGQRVALLVNHTSTLGEVHLADTLVDLGIDVRKIFAPEHGFRGSADAGAKIKDGRDAKTGLPIKSLYGKSKKPSVEDLADVDVIIFDIQDVGARFYTYISTLFYVLEAAGEQGKKVLILDRPNPNGHYVDGPVLQPGNESFVGIAPIPVVHGLTVGEFAQMAVGEGWLKNSIKANFEVITMPGYTHSTSYKLPIAPSPNLPNQRSIYLYPSLCFFEGTAVSVGRGTNTQFQVYGHPKLTIGTHTFTPISGPGSKYPKLENTLCHGVSFVSTPVEDIYEATKQGIDLDVLLHSYRDLTEAKVEFFTRPDFFDLLAGGASLRKAIERGDTEEAIRASWAADLAEYRTMRKEYLLYPE